LRNKPFFFREFSTVTANPRSPLLIRAVAELREGYAAQPALLVEQRAALARLLRQPRQGGPRRPSAVSSAAARSPCVPYSSFNGVKSSPAVKRPLTAWQLPEENDSMDAAPPSRPSTEDRLARLDRYTQNFAAKFGMVEGQPMQPLPAAPSPKFLGTVSLKIFL